MNSTLAKSYTLNVRVPTIAVGSLGFYFELFRKCLDYNNLLLMFGSTLMLQTLTNLLDKPVIFSAGLPVATSLNSNQSTWGETSDQHGPTEQRGLVQKIKDDHPWSAFKQGAALPPQAYSTCSSSSSMRVRKLSGKLYHLRLSLRSLKGIR